MAIREDGVGAVCVGELIEQNLLIPHYQRPYSWESATALQLLDDIRDALNDPERSDVPCVPGTVILHANGRGLDVVDGQQRLLTLRMILLRLEGFGVFGAAGRPDSPVARVWNALDRRICALADEGRKLAPFIRERCQRFAW